MTEPIVFPEQIESCFRTIIGARSDLRESVFEYQASDAITDAKIAGVDRVAVIDRLENIALSFGWPPEMRQRLIVAAVEKAEQANEVPDSSAALPGPDAMGFDVDEMNRRFALVLMGSRALVACKQQEAAPEDRLRLLSIHGMHDWFANKFTETVGRDGKIKTTTWSRKWLTHPHRRQYEGIEFFPNPDGAKSTPGYLNLWSGFSVTPRATGSYNIFRDHLLNNVCSGDAELFNWVFGWFAHLMQRPRERIGTALVLRGGMGTGKTKVGEVFGSLISAHYFLVDDGRHVTGQFNSHLQSCLLLQADEAVWAGDKAGEGRLKSMITADTQMIEQKGVDPIPLRNYVRLLMTSNESWVVPAGKDERRFAVFDVGANCAQNHQYFSEMDEELNAGGRERLLHDLLSFDLNTVDLRRIPMTAALLEQKIESLSDVDSWWLACLMEGTPSRNYEVWPPLVSREEIYADYLKTADEVGARRKRGKTTFAKRWRKLVGDSLDDTRPRNQSGRPRFYVLPSLVECRRAFEKQFGQVIEWPPGMEGEQMGSTMSDDDEVQF